jgi:hypothetical protein
MEASHGRFKSVIPPVIQPTDKAGVGSSGITECPKRRFLSLAVQWTWVTLNDESFKVQHLAPGALCQNLHLLILHETRIWQWRRLVSTMDQNEKHKLRLAIKPGPTIRSYVLRPHGQQPKSRTRS